ncbi:MAG: DUF6544 family protein [Enhygromyxa sp.]
MNDLPSLEALWDADEERPLDRFDPAQIAGLPAPARRYLEHGIEPGAPLYRAVRLRMHGEIKLGGWHPFVAEQVLRSGRGFVWRARARLMRVVHVKGQDSFVDGAGQMRWRLLGIIPVMSAEGPDLSRSAAGRAEIDSIFLPSSLLDPAVEWAAGDQQEVELSVAVPGDCGRLRLRVDEQGRLREVSMLRWGRPEGGDYHEVSFGGYLDAERRFGQLTIPTRIRAGWYFGSDRFSEEGEFFRATIDSVEFR